MLGEQRGGRPSRCGCGCRSAPRRAARRRRGRSPRRGRSRSRRRRRPRRCPWRSRARCCPWASRRPWPSARRARATGCPSTSPPPSLRGDRDRARELREELAAAGVDDRLLVLDPRPFGVPGHDWSPMRSRPAARERPIGSPPMATVPRARSSRPTTSAACTASRSTATSPSRSAARSSRVLADLAGKPAAELRVGLGRDMRLTAPELAARYREGMVARGRPRASTPGRSAPRCSTSSSARASLDGGLMCTASHNPKAYTGAKLVREGAIALSRRRGHPGHPPR